MADHYATDEFAFPLRAAERLNLLQGGRLSQGEYARAASSMRQPLENPDEPGMGFSLAEYSQAVGENVIFNMFKGRK